MILDKIIELCKANNAKGQKLLYDKYSGAMYGVCLRYSKDEEDAKDALQEGFIQVFKVIQSYEGRGSFDGWLRRVFVNLLLQKIRKEKSIHFVSETIEDYAEDLVDASTEEDLNTIPMDVLLKFISELPTGYRAVFNLYAIEDLSHKEIGEELGISEGTSRSQYIRARRFLQKAITEYLNEQ